MKFNYKGRGFVIITLTAMLVIVGTVNYQLSKKSLLETSKEFKAYEEAQLQKNTTDDSDSSNKEDSDATDKQNSKESADIDIVDSKASKVKEKVTETSKEIKAQLSSEKNMKKASYILDMKMNREKQRNELVQDLNEMINNPSTTEESRKEASNMKLNIVKTQEKELQIENLLSTKGYEEALVYISDSKVNVVVNEAKLDKKDAAKIFDLVAEQANVKYENIKLTNNNTK
ncbi:MULTISPECIES: SpoIIIAH-like family protein [unclassified Clostridioides]|uniref:SpoIIIAH-like family protein n=1 Tax=unclassified Clostridioides TaxID=2635829 RepID=UPI001D0C1D35|nr:SpoIIIAH-like family protein [Clostridioides sp. ES-S-0049-03]MCC0651689.1 SpoIIIAH-like family protein [Clostridioides sp. ES-S-0001-03]MCC0657497.1 SpoIIIAH-like family protein [Clostridioides sp. ES-S-0123-01]MCC0672903.1 SpoIIIAH-like family protein [Clostridioides sp. ES-S-0145-01]MCC0676809.1 SpoIIIAH-like family protein [Clostridioides sp. ES-W-0018-02]MCC0678773.1 SpoIIIAH-like family protein [Clostridioides sp. ES-S-0005-03]MCC0694078.1 SpoIIIAH-like family protein [Clostridioides